MKLDINDLDNMPAGDPEKALGQVIQKWLTQRSKNPCWANLVKALKDPIMIQRGDVAHSIIQEHLGGVDPVPEASPNPGRLAQLLTTKDFKDVNKAVYPVRAQWRQIGEKMELDVNDLQCIPASDPGKALAEMLEMWLRQRWRYPCWAKLVKTLRHPVVIGGKGLADDIIKKYLGGVDPAGEGSQPSDGTTGSTVSTVHPAAANSRRPSVATGKTPIMGQLHVLKSRDRLITIRIIDQVKAQYDVLAQLLQCDTDGTFVSDLRNDETRPTPSNKCSAVFESWLQGNGRPHTWDVLIEVLSDMCHHDLAGRIPQLLQ